MEINLRMLNEKYPYLSIGKYAKNEYVGIIQNSSKAIVSMYVLSNIHDKELKKKFLALAEEWWWASNRMIPIDIFMKGEFNTFKPYLMAFNAKEFELIHGPIVSLSSMAKKRIKRKQISLIRKTT